MNETNQSVQEYYGKTLQKSEDLKTNACCTVITYPDHIKKAMAKIHDEVMSKYYGCGLTIPTTLEGAKVLDLGSGSGRDCYLLSSLVGEKGEVIGVDMTDEQLDVANRHLDYHREQFGYENSNTAFLKGNIEKLDELDLKENSFDVIISNCVINLVEDKERVIKEVYRLLKPGGEFYFSDVYADRRVPADLQKDEVLWGECLSGALYWNDFQNMAKNAGFLDPRKVEDHVITVENKELEQKLGDIKFYSVTYRLFKLPFVERECEDYGHHLTYRGTVFESPDAFILDDHHTFKKDERMHVCGNTFNMIAESRLAPHFKLEGSFETHLGIFKECGEPSTFSESKVQSGCC